MDVSGLEGAGGPAQFPVGTENRVGGAYRTHETSTPSIDPDVMSSKTMSVTHGER